MTKLMCFHTGAELQRWVENQRWRKYDAVKNRGVSVEGVTVQCVLTSFKEHLSQTLRGRKYDEVDTTYLGFTALARAYTFVRTKGCAAMRSMDGITPIHGYLYGSQHNKVYPFQERYLAVSCPHCGAARGRPCKGIHAARAKKAAEQ